MPVTHWVMSWKEKEEPTKEQVIEAVEIFLHRMGLKGHQAIVAAHVNTSNFHVHIAVNRVHPLTEQVVQPHNGFDIEEAHRIVAEIEYRQGWTSEVRARYRVDENKRIVRNRRPKEVRPRAEAEDFEQATGEKSAQRIAQERGHAIMENAQSWAELHDKLAGVGLRFEKKCSGAIVWVGDTAVKASSVDRAFSMKKLCARLGEFEAGNYPNTQERIAPEPVSPVNREEWKTYQAEREKARKRPPAKEAASMTADLKERQKQERKEKLSRLVPYDLPVMNIARHCLWLQQRQEMRDLRRKLKRSRKTEGRLRFETWLALTV